jgi:protein-S-isoprenylcysteine O-methyltransferase Ste14
MGQRIFLALRSALYISGFAVLWLRWMPQWLNLRSSTNLVSETPVRWMGIVPLVLGAALAIDCFIRFFSVGKGTPAPFDAPRHLVISGLYRYVRNPMYLGAGLVLAGCTILFVELSIMLLGYAIAVIVIVNLFIFFYEEPTLRHKFGAEYEEYCRNVRRWIPRSQPWQPPEKEAAAAGQGH